MTNDLDQIIASARIVTPEEAAADMAELLWVKLLIRVARMASLPCHVVQFPDGVTLVVICDPNDKEGWRFQLESAYKAAISGYVGPMPIRFRGEE
jgi:hypothetical protein